MLVFFGASINKRSQFFSSYSTFLSSYRRHRIYIAYIGASHLSIPFYWTSFTFVSDTFPPCSLIPSQANLSLFQSSPWHGHQLTSFNFFCLAICFFLVSVDTSIVHVLESSSDSDPNMCVLDLPQLFSPFDGWSIRIQWFDDVSFHGTGCRPERHQKRRSMVRYPASFASNVPLFEPEVKKGRKKEIEILLCEMWSGGKRCPHWTSTLMTLDILKTRNLNSRSYCVRKHWSWHGERRDES